MKTWIFLIFFVTGSQGIDPTWIWDLIKLVKDISKIAETVNDIKGVSLTQDMALDLQKLRKQTERGIPDLKWTILQQRYDQEIEIPSAIVFRSSNEFLKRPNEYNKYRLQLACQKYWPSFIMQYLHMMLDDQGRSWYLEQLEILHFSSSEASLLKDQVMNSVEELVLNHAFCSSFYDIFDKDTVEHTLMIASNISSLLNQQMQKASQLYYPRHFELFAEKFIDNFDSGSCGSKIECNRKLGFELEKSLKKEFNYGQIFTIRVSQKEPYFTGRIPKDKVIEIKSNGFNVLIYKTDDVIDPPEIDQGIQNALDSYDSFFMIQNRLCNWNPFNPVGTLQKVFSVIDSYCGNSTFCAITKYDHNAQMTKTKNIASRCFYFVCFPFFKALTVIQGIPDRYEGTENRVVFTNEGSLWEDVLKTAVKLWEQRWEAVKRSKRELKSLGNQKGQEGQRSKKGQEGQGGQKDLRSQEGQGGQEDLRSQGGQEDEGISENQQINIFHATEKIHSDSMKCLVSRFLQEMDKNQGFFDNLYSEVHNYINTCSLNSFETFSIMEFEEGDGIKYFIPPVFDYESCDVVTMGVGNNIEAELKIKENYSQCEFFGVDPNEEISGILYREVLGGRFLNTAVGVVEGAFKTKVMNENNDKYHDEVIYHISFQDLLNQFYRNKTIDILFINIEGFRILEYIVGNANRLPPICQMNLELQFSEAYPFQVYEILKIFFKMVSGDRFLPLHADLVDSLLRIFIINIWDIKCRNTYLDYGMNSITDSQTGIKIT